MNLSTLQEAMFSSITGDGRLDEAAAVVRGGTFTAEARLGLYAEMYRLRMRDALRSDFPLLHRVLGDHDFDLVVAKYLRTCPSTHHSLGRLGHDFPAAAREVGPASLPWLADLATLEWARAEAFVALDAPTLSMSTLAALTEDTFATARLHASPSLRLLTPQWDVLSVWKAVESGGVERPEPERTAAPVVVWRQGFQVFHVALSPAEGRALTSVMQGLDLPTVCEAFGDDPDPVHAAFRAIGSWVNEGLIASLSLNAS